MRGTLLLAVLVLGAAWPAAATAAERPISAVLTGTVTESWWWGHGSGSEFEGEGVVKGLGKVSFAGTHDEGCNVWAWPNPDACWHSFDLTLTTASADTLVLSSRTQWSLDEVEPPLLEWTLELGDGRFAGYSGAGIVDLLAPEYDQDGTLRYQPFRLTGVLTTE